VNQDTVDDIFLIVGMVLIAYGFWDPSRLVLILAGALVIFVVLTWGDGDDKDREKETIGRP